MRNLLLGVHDFIVFGVVDAGHWHGINITKAVRIRRSIPLWSVAIDSSTTGLVVQEWWRRRRQIYALIDETIMITIHTCRRISFHREQTRILKFVCLIFGVWTASVQRNLFGWINCFVRMQNRIFIFKMLIINKVNAANKERRTLQYTRTIADESRDTRLLCEWNTLIARRRRDHAIHKLNTDPRLIRFALAHLANASHTHTYHTRFALLLWLLMCAGRRWSDTH